MSEQTPDPNVDQEIAAYDFRNVHPLVRFGTASDRYAGWIGQIYSDEWTARIQKRRKKLKSKSYTEAIVPTEAVREYFQHFSVLELDFTFYRPLIEPDGQISSNYRVLERYMEHSPATARFLVKAPQMFTADVLPGRGPNETYLERSMYDAVFGEPLCELLGDRLLGVIFEQGYLSRGRAVTSEKHVDDLDQFCRASFGHNMHFEIRSPHLLSPHFFEWLTSTGHGYVYSHWTWLPSIKDQWLRSGEFSSADNNVVVRLLTPRKMVYAKAYDLGHPFDKPVDALKDAPGSKEMISESVALAVKAVDQGKTINMIVNNRAWGNAPELARTISERLVAYERKKRSAR